MLKVTRRWLAALGILLITGCMTAGTRDAERASLLLRLGTSQIEAGDYPKALRSLLEAEKLDPANPGIQNNLGMVYFLRDRLDLAEKHIGQAVKLAPNFSDAKNNLGRVYIENGKPEVAIPLLQNVLRDLTYERPSKATLNLGLAYFKLGRFTEARSYFNKTLSFGRDNCMAQNYLGRSFYETKEYERASETLDLAVGFCKVLQFDEPHYYSALSYYQLGEKKKAESRLEEVMKMYSQGKYSAQAKNLLETIRK